MDEPNLRERLEELQQKYTALLHEHEEVKHLLISPQAQLKLAIFDRLPMPIWACDRDCRIVFWNSAAARLYGYSAEEAIGHNFVDLFVNEAEKEQARIDCVDIIDNDRPIRNMADDIDKHGNTRKLVTQCFAVYSVEGHSGLQVEISYEVQDIDRLQAELQHMQEEYKRSQEEREELRRKLVEVTRARALNALDSVVGAVKDRLLGRRNAVDQAELSKDRDEKMIKKARAEIKLERERLIKWEQGMRKDLMSRTKPEELETLIASIEQSEVFDV